MSHHSHELKELPQTGHRGQVLAAVISNSKTEKGLLISLDSAGLLIVWHLDTGKQLYAVSLSNRLEQASIPANRRHLYLPNKLSFKGNELWIYGRAAVFHAREIGLLNINITGRFIAFPAVKSLWELRGRFDPQMQYYYVYYISGNNNAELSPHTIAYHIKKDWATSFWSSAKSFDPSSHHKKLCIFDHAHLPQQQKQIAVYTQSNLRLGTGRGSELVFGGYYYSDQKPPKEGKGQYLPDNPLSISIFDTKEAFDKRLAFKLGYTSSYWLSPRAERIYWVGKEKIHHLSLDKENLEREDFTERLSFDEVYSLNGTASTIKEEGRYMGLVYRTSQVINLQVYDAESKKLLFSKKLNEQHRVLSFAEDGKYLITVNEIDGVIHLWRIKGKKREGHLKRKFFAEMSRVNSLSLQPSATEEEKLLITTSKGEVYSLALKEGIKIKPVQTFRGELNWVSRSVLSQQARVSGMDGDASVQAIHSGWSVTIRRGEKKGTEVIYRTSPSIPKATKNRIRKMQLSRCGRHLAVLVKGSNETPIYIYNTANFTSETITPELSRYTVKGLLGFTFHPNKRLFVTAQLFNKKLKIEFHRWGHKVLAGQESQGHFFFDSGMENVEISFSQSGRFFFLRAKKRFEVFEIRNSRRPDRAGFFDIYLLLPSKDQKSAGQPERGQLNDLFPSPPDQLQLIHNDQFLLLGWASTRTVEIWPLEKLKEMLIENQGKITPDLRTQHDHVSIKQTGGPYDTVIGMNNQPILFFAKQHTESIALVNWKTGVRIGKLYLVNDRKFTLIGPHYNYYTTPDGHDLMAFVFKKQIYQLGQFDVFLNRPHRILERMGIYSTKVVDLYRNAFERRLHDAFGWTSDPNTIIDRTKLALRELDETLAKMEEVKDAPFSHFIDSFKLPQIKKLSEVKMMDKGRLSFRIEVDTNGHKIDRLYISVNGVPAIAQFQVTSKTTIDIPLDAEGRGGVALHKVEPVHHTISGTMTLDLSEGENKIEFSALNALGGESLSKQIYVHHAESDVLPNLYVISIGINDYEDDKAENLNWGVTDAKEIIALFKQLEGTYYQKVNTYLFTSDQEENDKTEESGHWPATFQSIMGKLDHLKETVFPHISVNDRVILTYSGHGKIEDQEYYLGLQNTDFSRLGATGYSYKKHLEYLLDTIPPRNKLILLDACYSGRIDRLGRKKQEAAHTARVNIKVVPPTPSKEIASASQVEENDLNTGTVNETQTGQAKIKIQIPGAPTEQQLDNIHLKPEVENVVHTGRAKVTISVPIASQLKAEEHEPDREPELLNSPAFLKMQELFVDIRRGIGATVLSASAGNAKARENSDWKHGALSFCLLEGFKRLSEWQKNTIQINDLSSFLIDEVPRITRKTGVAQKAEMRTENIANNWVVGKLPPEPVDVT